MILQRPRPVSLRRRAQLLLPSSTRSSRTSKSGRFLVLFRYSSDLTFSSPSCSPYFSAGAGLMVSSASRPKVELTSPPLPFSSIPLLCHPLPLKSSSNTSPHVQIFTGGLAMSQKAVKRSAYIARRRLLVTLDIPSHDHSYPWFLEWMARNSAAVSSARSAPVTGGLFRRLAAMKEFKSHELSVETMYKKHDNGSSEAVFSLIPGPGTHYFNYQGAWIQVNRHPLSRRSARS